MKHVQAVIASVVFLSNAVPAFADCDLDTVLKVPMAPHLDSKPNEAYDMGDGSQVFLGRFFIDADGAPKAYHKNEAIALDKLKNAGEPGNWWALATDAEDCGPTGTPVIQGENDPAPGYYVTPTSMSDPTNENCRDPRKYVNSTKIPFLAISPKIRKFDYKSSKGALAVVVNLKNGKRAFAVHADEAPNYGFGEGSIALAMALGYDPDPKTGGTDEQQNVIVLFKEVMGFPKNAKAVELAAAQALVAWGGEERLQECVDELKADSGE